MWKEAIRVGQKGIPVKLFAAVEDTDIHFHLLHASDGIRVEQHSVHPQSVDEVPAEQVRRGYPLHPGVFVILEDKELEALEPKPSRDIGVTSFVPKDHSEKRASRRA
jgi:DNA end-binding protein Ku